MGVLTRLDARGYVATGFKAYHRLVLHLERRPARPLVPWSARTDEAVEARLGAAMRHDVEDIAIELDLVPRVGLRE